MVLKESDISVFVANWKDKATNIKSIQEKLNIGFDSIVFFDDNPFERNLVRKLLPEVIVPELPEDPAEYLKTISELNLFETSTFSNLDMQRNNFYQNQNKREEGKLSFHSIEEYLESLETKVLVTPFTQNNLPRIAQLIQRSNQFNLTTKRYSEVECANIMKESKFETFTITVNDKYGDFGLICIVVLEFKESILEIDTFLMSCRVLQRGIEQFAMNKIFEIAKEKKLNHVIGRYIPTKKNQMVKDFYKDFGFEKINEDQINEETLWKLDLINFNPIKVFINEISNIT
jgi:FkbH-like protein